MRRALPLTTHTRWPTNGPFCWIKVPPARGATHSNFGGGIPVAPMWVNLTMPMPTTLFCVPRPSLFGGTFSGGFATACYKKDDSPCHKLAAVALNMLAECCCGPGHHVCTVAIFNSYLAWGGSMLTHGSMAIIDGGMFNWHLEGALESLCVILPQNTHQ